MIAPLVALVCAGAVWSQPQLRFTEVTDGAGIWPSGSAWGVTAVDIDGDGDVDLLMANNGADNIQFINEGGLRLRGDLLRGGAQATEALVPGDIDQDGILDLVACAWPGAPEMLLGNGDGTFSDFAEVWGMITPGNAKTGGAALGDIDGDGDPDLYMPDGGLGDRLYVNGGNSFADVTQAIGLPQVRNSESALMADFDDDGRLDVYVPRYDDSSALYLNLEGGGLRDLSAESRVFAAPMQLGATAFDVDGDGDLDLLVNRGRFSPDGAPNLLLANQGGGQFVDGTPPAWQGEARHYHSACAGDVDNDGDRDVLTCAWEGSTLWLNDGAGGFSRAETGLPLDDIPGSAGLLVDLDGDGDLDILIRARPTDENADVLEHVFRNDLNDGNWLEVRPIDRRGGRFCAGAQVRVYEGSGLGDAARFVARQDIVVSRGWCTYGPFTAHFGLDGTREYDVEVRFTDGSRGAARNVKAGQRIEARAQ